MPAFAHSSASLDDGVAQVTRYARHWSYGVDGAAGAAFEVYGARSGAIRPRLWVIAEGGYGYLGSRPRSSCRPDAGQGPQRPVPVDLGTLSLAGPYLPRLCSGWFLSGRGREATEARAHTSRHPKIQAQTKLRQ